MSSLQSPLGREIRPQDGKNSEEGEMPCEASLIEERTAPLGSLKFIILDIQKERVCVPSQDYWLQSLGIIVRGN